MSTYMVVKAVNHEANFETKGLPFNEIYLTPVGAVYVRTNLGTKFFIFPVYNWCYYKTPTIIYSIVESG